MKPGLYCFKQFVVRINSNKPGPGLNRQLNGLILVDNKLLRIKNPEKNMSNIFDILNKIQI